MFKHMPRISLFSFAITAGLSVGLFLWARDEADGGVDFFARKSYYVILLMFMCWAVSTVRLKISEKWSLRAWAKENKLAIWGALALVLVARFSIPMEFKTLSDETNLLSVSQSMINDRTVFNTTLAKNFYGNLNPVFVSVPTRPLMHPFFLHLVHQLFGYHYQNGFYLNLFCYGLILLMVFWVGKKLSGPWMGLASQILVASYGIFPISATSAGYDLLSVLFFMIVFGALRGVFRSPTPDRFLFLYFSAFVFFNIRYESILFLPILALAVLASKKWSAELTQKTTWSFSLAPIFVLPFLIQRALTPNPYEAPSGVEPFSAEHVLDHLVTVVSEQIHPLDTTLPYALLINWLIPLTIIGAVLFVVQGRWKALGRELQVWIGALVLGFIATQLIFLAHHLGVYNHPTQARFFLLLSLLGALSPAILSQFFPKVFTGGRTLVLSFAMFLIYQPITLGNRFLNTLVLNRETRQNITFLESLPTKNILFVSDRPGQYSAIGYG